MVLRTAYRLLGNLADAQDATQEVFLRMVKHQGGLGPDAKAWLYRVTVNICNDYHRGKKVSAVELSCETAAAAPDPEKLLGLKQRKQLLLEGLVYLAPRERVCLVLRDIEGLSTTEVAKILGIEEATVRGYAHEARVKLAKYVRRAK
jgi:RNA polymerase sigma-70 factor, ECF subfamily